MTSLAKKDSLFGEKYNKRPLLKSNVDYKDPQSYTYLTDMDHSNYILTPVSFPLVVMLYHIQNGQPRLIAYASKRMPEAAKNYSITELEMCGLTVNIVNVSHLLKKVDFDAVVDHLAITHIMKSKAEPTMTRIKRLIEILRPYCFNLYYIKGKDMVLSNFLSRQKTDDSNPCEIIPISFTLKNLASNHFYQFNSTKGDW